MASSGHVNKVLGKVVETNNYSSDQPFQIVVQIDKQNALKLKQEQLPCFLSITRNNADTDSAEVHLILTVASLDHEPIKHGEETRIDTAHNQPHICPHEEINLLCSRSALEYYKIEPNEKVWVWVTPVYNADKVVLGAMTERAFRWANHQLFSTGLLVSLCQQPVLIQKGYILNPPVSEIYKNDEEFDLSMLKEITVLECSPNRQGVLCVKTEIIVLDMWKHEHLNVDIIKSCDTLNTGKALMVSDFANKRNVFSKCARSSLNGYTEAQSVKNPEQINLASLGVLFDFRQIKCASKNCKPKHDANSMIIVSYKVAKHFKLFNACYVKIQLTDTNDCKIHVRKSKESETALDDDGKKPKSYRNNPKGARFRIVQVNICPDAYLPNSTSQPAIVYCSSALYFHLAMGKRPTSKIYPTVIIQKLQTNKDEKDSSSTSWSSMLPFATELYLASINCPQYGPSAAIELAVLEYFNTTRLVQLGDVIPVITKGDAEFHQNLVEGCTQHQPVVYLKIKKIVPKMKPNQTFMADANHTCVFQDGATHSYVPSALSLTSSSLYCEDGVPPGLLAETETMVKTLLPYIENSRACEDLPASVLLHGPSGCGKTAVVSAVAAALHLHLYQVSCHELVGDTSAATEARLAFIMQKACNYSPCLLLLNGIHTLGYDRDGHTEDARVGSYFHRDAMKILKEDSEWPIVVVASTTSPKHLTAHMYEGFLHTQQIEPPNEAQRLDILRTLLVMKNCSLDVSIPYLAQRTAGFVLGDFLAMLASAFRAAYQRLHNMSSPSGRSLSPAEELSLCQGCALLPADFEEALSQLQGAHSDAIGAPKIPDVRWSDVGGLISVKTEILDTIQLPLQHPHLFASGMRRSGVLLYGPPGTGKTLLAKAVATECSLNFLSVKGPELINMYVGQSEENVREVFTRARSAAPCVIFFDELDSLAPNRGRSGDSGGVMDRVVSQLLAELDGLHKACDVFVIGATNRPDLLDPALLRPGRFDKLLYLSVSPDHASQLHILQALTKRFELASDCCLERVIEDCPLNMTGADFYALCSDTMLQSMKRVIDALDAGAETNQNKVVVTEEDFMNALKCLVPSVSISELHRYQELHNHFTQK